MRETRRTQRWFFFKGADTVFSATCSVLTRKVQPRVSQYDLFHGNTVNGSWITVVTHLTTRCLCNGQAAVTHLVWSTRWLVPCFILRGCVVRSKFIWTRSCALIDKRLRTYVAACVSSLNINVASPSFRHSDNTSCLQCIWLVTQAREKQCRKTCVEHVACLARHWHLIFLQEFLKRSWFPCFTNNHGIVFCYCLVARQVKPQFMSLPVFACPFVCDVESRPLWPSDNVPTPHVALPSPSPTNFLRCS